MELTYIDRPFEVKAVDDKGRFSGYGSVFGNVDAYQEIVAPGAFAESLAAWKDAGKLPPSCGSTAAASPSAPTSRCARTRTASSSRAAPRRRRRPRKGSARLMKARAVNGLSIGFVTREDSYDKVTGVRTLKKIDLWEVSIVTFPANPAAQISNVKSAVEALETLAEAERYLRDAGGFSKSAALAFIARVKSLSGRVIPMSWASSTAPHRTAHRHRLNLIIQGITMTTIAEVTTLVESIQQGFADFKKLNDERLAKVEKGAATGDFEAKLAAVQGDIAKALDLKKEIERVEAKANLQGIIGEHNERNPDKAAYKAAFFKEFVRKGKDTAELKALSVPRPGASAPPPTAATRCPKKSTARSRSCCATSPTSAPWPTS